MDRYSGFRIAKGVKGDKTLLLGHGFGWTQAVWQRLLPLVEEEFSWITYNWIGANRDNSAFFSPVRYDNLFSYAEDLLEILSQEKLSRIVYVGHSVSGMIGVLAATARPEFFQKLVLISASPRYLDEEGYQGGFNQTVLDQIYSAMQTNFLEWIGGFSKAVSGEDPGKFIQMDFASSLQSMDPQVAQSIARMIFQSDLRRELPKCPVPCIIVQPKEDPSVPLAIGKFLRDKLPNTSYYEVNTTGHFPQLEAPEQIAHILKTKAG